MSKELYRANTIDLGVNIIEIRIYVYPVSHVFASDPSTRIVRYTALHFIGMGRVIENFLRGHIGRASGHILSVDHSGGTGGE